MKLPKGGLYIAIEGTDGSGSTTQIERFVLPWLARIGIGRADGELIHGSGYYGNVVAVREPGGTEEAEILRKELLHDKKLKFTPKEEFAKFTKARSLLSLQVVEPALSQDKLVVSERCYISSYAYQGYGLGLDKDKILTVSAAAISPRMFKPDAWLLIDVTSEEARRRMEIKGYSADKIEDRDWDFFARVHEGYKEAAQRFNIPIINGHQKRYEVGRDIVASLAKQLDLPIN